MDERTTGIILRIRPYSETTLIVHWLCAEAGRIATLAKGARRAKSPFAGRLDLFFEAEFSFQRSRKSDLHLLKEVNLRETHRSIREDLSKLNAVAYFAILMESGTETETPLGEFYVLMRDALQALTVREGNLPLLICGFEWKFLDALGVQPDFSTMSREEPELLKLVRNASLLEMVENRARGKDIGKLTAFLRTAIGMALEKLPPQRERAFQNAFRTTESFEGRG